MNDYRAAAYQIWYEYIVAAQGYLKFLMPYAQAADDAQVSGSGASANAATIAGQYLVVTASEPE